MNDYENYISKLYRPSPEKEMDDDFVRLDRNEPPFSAFEVIDGVISNDELKSLNHYPEIYSLYQKIAKLFHQETQQLLLTHGSEQGIRYVFDTFLDSGDEVVYLDPSYAMYDVYSYYKKAKINKIEFGKSRVIDLSQIYKAVSHNTRLFVLANPNNPTGSVFTIKEIIKIAQHTFNNNTIFLLDEAYFYYYKIDTLNLIKQFPNLIITRSLSKAWGLAGARVGLVFSNSKNISLLSKQKPMHEINQLSILVCDKVLSHADEIVSANVNQVKKWKEIFKAASLSNLEYLETEGNYFLLKSKTYEIHKRLLFDEKFIPKMDFPTACLKNCFRFSVGNDYVMNRLISIFN